MGEYVFAHGFDMMICHMRGWAYLKAQGLSSDEAIEVQKANARLIAAAPEMYELLRECMKKIYSFDDTYRRIEQLLERINGDTLKGGESECRDLKI